MSAAPRSTARAPTLNEVLKVAADTVAGNGDLEGLQTAIKRFAKAQGADGLKTGGKRAKRAPKDANAPKKPLTAYMFFCKDARGRIKADEPELSFGELGKKLGEMWKVLDDTVKKEFVDLALKDKERFDAERAA